MNIQDQVVEAVIEMAFGEIYTDRLMLSIENDGLQVMFLDYDGIECHDYMMMHYMQSQQDLMKIYSDELPKPHSGSMVTLDVTLSHDQIMDMLPEIVDKLDYVASAYVGDWNGTKVYWIGCDAELSPAPGVFNIEFEGDRIFNLIKRTAKGYFGGGAWSFLNKRNETMLESITVHGGDEHIALAFNYNEDDNEWLPTQIKSIQLGCAATEEAYGNEMIMLLVCRALERLKRDEEMLALSNAGKIEINWSELEYQYSEDFDLMVFPALAAKHLEIDVKTFINSCIYSMA